MNTSVIEIEEKRLEKLPPQELRNHLMQLPARKRLEVILGRTDAEAVVAAMAEQDFYFTVKEIGRDEALPLLSMARRDQIDHLFDLEWWEKDRILPARSLEWLDLLAEAGEEKFLEWLYHTDYELLVSLFKKWIHVVVIPEETDLTEARDQLPRYTLDDQYFWEAHYPQYEDLLTRILGFLFETHHGFYLEIMDHIVWALDTEVEEDAYRFHRGRLEDRAIPDFYDALDIYRSVRPEEIPHTKTTVDSKQISDPPASFALAQVPEQDLLGRALREIRDESLFETLQHELAALSNKVIVADQISLDEAENLHEAVNKAITYVNLGLHLKSAGNLQQAVVLLREVFLEYLFRLGQSQVNTLKNRLQKVRRQGWLSRWPSGLNLLDPPWDRAAELLLGKTPRLLRFQADSEGSFREDLFRTPADLFEGKRLIDTLIALGPLFEALDVDAERLESILWHGGQARILEDVTLGMLLWTAAACLELEGKWEAEPLTVDRWPDIFPRLTPAVIEKSIRSHTEEIFPDTGWRTQAETYLNFLSKAYAEEMAAFCESGLPAPELIRFFLFKKED